MYGHRGMTLIEIIIYIGLISILITGLISFVYEIYINLFELNDAINDAEQH